MDNKLIPLSDFVLENKEIHYSRNTDKLEVIENYANFLKQPLKLEMFVPVDKEGNVLKEPKRWKDYLQSPESFDGNEEWYEFYAYETALQKVLFEGWIHEDRYGWVQHHKLGLEINTKTGTLAIFHENGIGYGYVKNVEDLVSYELTLTPSVF